MAVEDRRKLTVVVPFLNEEQNLPLLFDRLCKVMEGQPEALQVLFVDDGVRRVCCSLKVQLVL